MVSCKNCATQNSLDSAFCKKCGSAVPADEARIASERLERVVADGFKAFNSGRVDEAMHIAENAVAENPGSTTALSLKAMCHERRGEISEALGCHERVLEIDPDSMIDKIKVNDLRNLLVTSTSAAAVPNRKFAIVGAVAAFVLVASIGVIFAKGNNPEPVASNVQQVGSPIDPAMRFDPSQGYQSPPGAQTQNTQQANPNTQNSTPQTQANPQQEQPAAQDTTSVPQYQAPSSGAKLPAPTANPSIFGTIPVTIKPEQVPQQQPKAKPPVPETKGPDPDPQTEANTQPSAPKEAPGVMEIKVISRNGKPTDGSQADTRSSANGVEALMRTARHQYQTGNYAAAAQSYERALRAGADAATGNQRLAQCYEKLGRNGEASAAYGRAIAAMESDLSAGRGDRDRIAAALDSCKQALKVLGG